MFFSKESRLQRSVSWPFFESLKFTTSGISLKSPVWKPFVSFHLLSNSFACLCTYLVNPPCPCAARVTVLGSCVCVCLSALFWPLRVKVSPENDTNASSRQNKENKTGDFLKNALFKSYGVICSLCRHSAVL